MAVRAMIGSSPRRDRLCSVFCVRDAQKWDILAMDNTPHQTQIHTRNKQHSEPWLYERNLATAILKSCCSLQTCWKINEQNICGEKNPREGAFPVQSVFRLSSVSPDFRLRGSFPACSLHLISHLFPPVSNCFSACSAGCSTPPSCPPVWDGSEWSH